MEIKTMRMKIVHQNVIKPLQISQLKISGNPRQLSGDLYDFER